MDPPIIHRDIKSLNILLDESYNASLGDFGLARICPEIGALSKGASTRIFGSPGYIDPDYAKTGKVTLASDVFAFGMVMLELLSSMQIMDDTRVGNEHLMDFFEEAMKNGKLSSFIDVTRAVWDKTAANKLADLAKQCIHVRGKYRPSITDVAKVTMQLYDTFKSSAVTCDTFKPVSAVTCDTFKHVSRSMKDQFQLPDSSFDVAGDRCFCRKCMQGDTGMRQSRGERPYVVPTDCIRIGLYINHSFVEINDVFAKWDVAFHGTPIEGANVIFKSGAQLLKAGDTTLGGNVLGVRPGHITSVFERTNLYTKKKEMFDKDQIFSSPSLIYSFDCYAKPFDLVVNGGKPSRAKVAFQLRQRPGSYSIGQETVGAKKEIDPMISNNELEYYTKENIAIVVYGLLVKVEGITTTVEVAWLPADKVEKMVSFRKSKPEQIYLNHYPLYTLLNF